MPEKTVSSTEAVVARAAALVTLIGAIAALSLQLLDNELGTAGYLWQNQLPISLRVGLVKGVLAGALLPGLSVLGIAILGVRRYSELPQRLWRAARVLSPLAPLSAVPILLRWQLWKDNELVFLLLTLATAIGFRASIVAASNAGPVELFGLDELAAWRPWVRARQFIAKAPLQSWLVVTILGALAYIIWFSYYTVVWHRSARSGWDLSIEDNIIWNTLHGGHFFKATPALGPTGSHFARHATVIAYLLVPFYALHQSAETLLVLQSLWIGAAAIPLFLFGRKRLGEPVAALVALLYLMHPGVQQSNLFEMHYIKLGVLPFWTTIWLLDSRRYRSALVAAVVTMMVREDVATWVLVLGMFLFAAGYHRRTVVWLLTGAVCYVGIVKFVVMPALSGGHDELIFLYEGLLPEGKGSFGWALATAATNPVYLLTTLLTSAKLVFCLHILVPLLFIPLRRAVGWVAIIPGFVFDLLAPKYGALTDIHFQYSHHFLSMLYPALVMVLGAERGGFVKEDGSGKTLGARNAAFIGTVAAMALATLLCSSQFGAVIQQNTSRGGPIPYRFGWDDEGRARRLALDELMENLPKEASVAASAFTITQVSSRANAYSLSIDTYDAAYIVATTNRNELVPSERTNLSRVIASGDFGLVAVRKPFFLMQRGYSTADNARVEQWIR